jgi:hypothetical protein
MAEAQVYDFLGSRAKGQTLQELLGVRNYWICTKDLASIYPLGMALPALAAGRGGFDFVSPTVNGKPDWQNWQEEVEYRR